MLPSRNRSEFLTYLQSPFFNQRETLVQLYEAIQKTSLNSGKPIDREYLYQAVFPGKDLNENSLKTLMTQLFGLLKGYLAVKQFQEDKPLQQRMLLRELNELGEQKYFNSVHSRAVKTLKSADLHTSDHLYELMLLEEEYDDYKKRQPNHRDFGKVEDALRYLNQSYWVRLLRYRIRLLNHQATFHQESVPEFIGDTFQYLKNNLEDMPWVVRVYFQVYESLQFPDNPDLFKAAHLQLQTHAHQFSQVEAEELYVCILNLGLWHLNRGNHNFLPDLLEVYQEALEMKVIVENGMILSSHLRNICSIALRLGKFDWVKSFLEEWKDKVLGDHANNAYQYVMGMSCHYQKRFAEAERYFNEVLEDYKNLYYGINARGFLLQIYYETGNGVGLESMSHSFRMFLDRNKDIPEERRYQYIAFINHLKRLCNIGPKDKERLLQLRETILEKDEKGMGSTWLLEKIGHLIGEKELSE